MIDIEDIFQKKPTIDLTLKGDKYMFFGQKRKKVFVIGLDCAPPKLLFEEFKDQRVIDFLRISHELELELDPMRKRGEAHLEEAERDAMRRRAEKRLDQD